MRTRDALDRRDAVRAPVTAEERQRAGLARTWCGSRAVAAEQRAHALVVAVVLAAQHRCELERPAGLRRLQQQRHDEVGAVEVPAELVDRARSTCS